MKDKQWNSFYISDIDIEKPDLNLQMTLISVQDLMDYKRYKSKIELKYDNLFI